MTLASALTLFINLLFFKDKIQGEIAVIIIVMKKAASL